MKNPLAFAALIAFMLIAASQELIASEWVKVIEDPDGSCFIDRESILSASMVEQYTLTRSRGTAVWVKTILPDQSWSLSLLVFVSEEGRHGDVSKSIIIQRASYLYDSSDRLIDWDIEPFEYDSSYDYDLMIIQKTIEAWLGL